MNNSITEAIVKAAEAMSYWEVIAVILSFFYVYWAMKENNLCWYAAFGSTAILTFLFWDASLLMESGLQVYYLLMAVYGWYQWKYGFTQNNQTQAMPIQVWSAKTHIIHILVVSLLAIGSGYLLQLQGKAAWPFIDSFTTWGAVLTTYMVTQKVLENWVYWIVLDAISIFMYWDRELYLLSLQMVVYTIMAIIGFIAWYKKYRNDTEKSNIEKSNTAMSLAND